MLCREKAVMGSGSSSRARPGSAPVHRATGEMGLVQALAQVQALEDELEDAGGHGWGGSDLEAGHRRGHLRELLGLGDVVRGRQGVADLEAVARIKSIDQLDEFRRVEVAPEDVGDGAAAEL